MTTFRKILALILCLCTIFAFASCDTLTEVLEKINGKDPADPATPGAVTSPLTKEQWNAALRDELFNNVTFKVLATFEGEDEPESIICKLAGTRAAISEGGFEEQEVDSDTRDAIKSIYVNTILAMLENFDNFTYDAEAKAFVSANDIVYNVEVFEYDAKITTSGTKVKFDTNNNVAEISCHMKHEFLEDGQPRSLEFEAVFQFYDYGTTVVGSAGSSDTTALDEAYKNSCNYDNFSIYVEATETLNDGTVLPEYMIFRSTETTMHVDSGSHEVYYAIEDGKNYMYIENVDGWQRYAQNSTPIGALVEMYVGQFAGIFDKMTFDAENNVYYIENVRVPLTESGIFYHYISIEIQNGLIYELTYIVDTYDYNTETPTVAGRGVAVLTFTDYGTTTVELPELGTGGSAQGEMTKEEWDAAFANTAASSNFTVMQSSTRIPFEGEQRTSISILGTTASASHTTDPNSSSEAYHSIEDGNYYYYYSSDGTTWTKNNASPQSSPIGSAVIQQFTELFKGVYEHLTYDATSNSYVGKNFVLNQRGTDYTIHDFRIEFENGLISEIYYVSDMYGSSGGEMVLSGRGSSVIQIYDYGTTVVELPTDYTDNTTT